MANDVARWDVVLLHQLTRQRKRTLHGARVRRVNAVLLRVADFNADAVCVQAAPVQRPAARLRTGRVLVPADRPRNAQIVHALDDLLRVNEVVRARLHDVRCVVFGVVHRRVSVVAGVVDHDVADTARRARAADVARVRGIFADVHAFTPPCQWRPASSGSACRSRTR